MRNKALILPFAISISLFTGTAGFATPVTYDEAVSGDLATFDPSTLALDVGINRVIGSSEYSSLATDFDGFLVSLGAGLRLDSVTYFISGVSVGAGTGLLTTGYALRNGGHFGTTLSSTTIDLLLGTPQSMFADVVPIDGVFALSTSPTFLSRGGPGGTWNYEIQLNVSSVPDRGNTATLLVSGLLLLLIPSLRRA